MALQHRMVALAMRGDLPHGVVHDPIPRGVIQHSVEGIGCFRCGVLRMCVVNIEAGPIGQNQICNAQGMRVDDGR